ncbi:FAD-binding domain-containing protein [Terfezia boudieri ATCC MYA-4762]|uniref:FAD-binding domain-containing protein n=1 Tax=Terfezia boudieri ATCC MYA-4762 TaxID=1051890 RepID=A0A3N4LD23_9PEZI|nr:FAD-binding domain-containing protein [Terfezia boudieri ATCC MYA-4762]
MQLPPIGVFATLLLLPFSVTAGTVESLRHCKCQPNLPCWPSDSDWQKFNSTVGGMLIADIRPISSACYEGTPEYNKARCDEVTKEFGDSFWRANQPGAVQHTNWETYPPLKESCYLPSSLSNKTGDGEQCKQGSVPRYAVRARNANDISAAVKFAAKHSIPVVIKNTGHDFLGRASRRNALLIWTHFMRDISFENQYGGWEPAGCKGDKYKENELLVRAEAGVMVFELTKEVSKKGRTVVAGAASTVGVVGGFIQGGGHSPLGVWKGLASDHAVEFEVVLADGSIVSASACTNPDLFWALRGGGGSTYGIVTSVVLRTHEDVSMVQYGLNVTIPILPNNTGAANDTFWELVSRWHSMAPAVNDLGGGGYYFLTTNFPMPETKITAHLFLAFLFVFGQKDTKEVEKLFNPLHDWLYKTVGAPESGLVSLLISGPEPTLNYLGTLAGTEDGQGNPVIPGSRLLSRELLSTPSGVQKATDALRDIEYLGGSIIIGHYVTPGPKPVDSAAHSAWRKAITHIVVGNSWEQGDSFEKQEEIKSLMTDVMVPRLKKLDYDTKTGKQTMGAYVNESDKEELDWQDSFWGEKYGRLKKIKAKYDPNGVFWCRPCVGSEDWDLNGICKVPH